MTRIVAGFAGSLTLKVPKSGTRPTSDRVREAIFSALDARDIVRGARVFDLFAGSGALGLEAASRGASHVVLVEKNAQAADICRQQRIRGRQGCPALRRAHHRGTPGRGAGATSSGPALTADLVFIDPPYEVDDTELLAVLTALVPHLAPHAVVCVERSARDPQPTLPRGLELDRRKDYGETALYWVSPE